MKYLHLVYNIQRKHSIRTSRVRIVYSPYLMHNWDIQYDDSKSYVQYRYSIQRYVAMYSNCLKFKCWLAAHLLRTIPSDTTVNYVDAIHCRHRFGLAQVELSLKPFYLKSSQVKPNPVKLNLLSL